MFDLSVISIRTLHATFRIVSAFLALSRDVIGSKSGKDQKDQKMATLFGKKNLIVLSTLLVPGLSTTLPDARPAYDDRTFHSTAVDNFITEVFYDLQ